MERCPDERRSAITISQNAATAGPVFVACANILAGVHSLKRRCAEGIWSATVIWLRYGCAMAAL